MRSIAGIAGTPAIGRALRTGHPFSEELALTLRSRLGDWRDPMRWKPEILDHPALRPESYASLGFNRDLTDFPPLAFDQNLVISGLRRQPPPLVARYEYPVSPSGEADEEADLVRTNRAHDRLQRLETHCGRSSSGS
jgi:hypothetical protein